MERPPGWVGAALRPTWSRVRDGRSWALLLGATIAYVALHPLAYRAIGPAAAAFSVLPVMVAGWRFGLLVGALVGLACSPLSAFLTAAANPALLDDPRHVGYGTLALALMGGVVGRLRDLTDQVQEQARELRRQLFTDPLTGLANRLLFLDRLEHALARARRDQETVAVMFLDLDRFKQVNDTLGHRVGDELLITVAQRLSAALRAGDTPARFGGDEFVVLLEGVADAGAALRIAERVIQHVREPVVLAGQVVRVTTSIGIVLSPPAAPDPDRLLRQADRALYRAKNTGRNCATLYSELLEDSPAARRSLPADLRRAIERNEFRLYYQPVVALAGGRIVALEALARWARPEQEAVPAASFLAAANESGLVLGIDRWVLREACQQATTWPARPGRGPAPGVSVNVSALQFQQPDLADQVAAALQDAGLAPERLTLEIAESVLTADLDAAARQLAALRRLGVHLAIDDFGTGQATLSGLRLLVADTAKLAPSLLTEVVPGYRSEVVLQAAVSLARALGMAVVAKGVETAEQAERAVRFGCAQAQGYYFVPPLPAEALDELLAEWPERGRLVGRPRSA
jgi:diguanylate cyclase (GGDEF)-like protein